MPPRWRSSSWSNNKAKAPVRKDGGFFAPAPRCWRPCWRCASWRAAAGAGPFLGILRTFQSMGISGKTPSKRAKYPKYPLFQKYRKYHKYAPGGLSRGVWRMRHIGTVPCWPCGPRASLRSAPLSVSFADSSPAGGAGAACVSRREAASDQCSAQGPPKERKQVHAEPDRI